MLTQEAKASSSLPPELIPLFCRLLQEMATSMEADAEDLLVLDFQATWCGPCKMMVPVVEQLARVQPHLLNVDMLMMWQSMLPGI